MKGSISVMYYYLHIKCVLLIHIYLTIRTYIKFIYFLMNNLNEELSFEDKFNSLAQVAARMYLKNTNNSFFISFHLETINICLLMVLPLL